MFRNPLYKHGQYYSFCLQVKFGNTTFKTDVYPKSLNPQWNSEWFKFEVSVSSLGVMPVPVSKFKQNLIYHISTIQYIAKSYIVYNAKLCLRHSISYSVVLFACVGMSV